MRIALSFMVFHFVGYSHALYATRYAFVVARSSAVLRSYTRNMAEMGRLLVILGVALVVIGGIVMLLGRAGLPLGRLPGDVLYRGKNTTFYFPLASCILISVVLSIVLFLIGRLKR
jgi:hypothetical protein